MSEKIQIVTAIIAALKANVALSALLATYASTPAVFTHAPEDKTLQYPYLVLFDVGLDGDDNDAHLGFDGVLNLHSWSDSRDMATVGNIQKAIYDILHHAEFTMTGYNLVDIHQEFSTILRDPDGITLHGVQRYRISLQTI